MKMASQTKPIIIAHSHLVSSIYIQIFTLVLPLCIAHMHARANIVSPTIPSVAKSSARKYHEDSLALMEFKSMITHDPRGVLRSWNDSLHFCQWEGITCGPRHRRVTTLDLNSKGLVGSLSPSLGNLTFLRKIYLYNNTFRGEIPQQFGRLFQLQELYLNNNSLVGNIPANLSHCSKLKYLYLGRNHLTGKIPLELQLLSNLQVLALHRNYLVGGLAPFLGNLTSLESLSLAYNSIGGSIPDDIGRLKNLSEIGLSGNNLSGMIPPSIYNLSYITIFSVSENQLHGYLPSNIGFAFPHLSLFQITGNLFTGSIPVSFSNASNLEFFDVMANALSGKVLVNFWGKQNLFHLNLGFNYLGTGDPDEMSFISSLANCSNLNRLFLGRNKFKGTLPPSISNLSSQLERFFIDYNQLYGAIPSGIGNLVSLNYLAMEHNWFTGEIPGEIGKLQRLNHLSLHQNKFSGKIPYSFGNLTSLLKLYLQDNNLQGTIPPSLGHCHSLLVLNLSRNELVGAIPNQLFLNPHLPLVSLHLASNHLVGLMPSSLCNLENLGDIDVSDNRLSGVIPNESASCTHLQNLYMQGNLFQGSIPQSFRYMRGIENIDLSSNKLVGEIPDFFETLSLKALNLSFNDLEGEVPTRGVFANDSRISLVGNKRLCGGISELKLPHCFSKSSRKHNLPLVLKIMIPLSCVVIVAAMLALLAYQGFSKRRDENNSGLMLRNKLVKVSYKRLLEATNGFSSDNLIGVGCFGSVYKGQLDLEGDIVAIKVLNLQIRHATKSFIAECNALKAIRHRNLVKIITCCSSVDFHGNDFKALVYKFMPKGNLDYWLHPNLEDERQVESRTLSILQRTNIAIDVAYALEYLHHQIPQPMIHCDLKPSNILLDDDMTAHVGDFGLVKFLPELSVLHQSSSLGVRGTIGYAPPEYGLGSKASLCGDVYSFGIMLLEIITGKRPTDAMFEGALSLHNYAMMALPNHVMSIVDMTIVIDEEEDATGRHRQRIQARNEARKACLQFLVRVGVACSMELPEERMDIESALIELQSAKEILLRHGINH